LEKLVGVFEEILEFVPLGTKRFRRQLRGNLDSCNGRILRDIANFIDLNARLTGERGFQLFRERGRLCVATGKRAHKPRELRLRQSWSEVDAGNSRAGQELCKTLFTGGSAERHTIQQNLVPGGAKQEAATHALIERTAELFPGGFKLRGSPHVAKFIKPREFQ
jgi:hypothetical protein